MSKNQITPILQPNYWELQLHLVTLLAFIGIEKRGNERLDLFKLKLAMRQRLDDPVLLADINTLIDEMVELRTQGLEPTHEDGKYV